jgi:sugar O-acyltransferase (sialic acid O-acetyltransferase NeuD family)
MRKIAIFGSTTLANLAHYYLCRNIAMKVDCFVVDAAFKMDDNFQSLPLLAWPEFIETNKVQALDMFVAVGYRSVQQRAAIYDRIKTQGFNLINIISPDCFIADNAVLGDNNFFMPGVVIEPGAKIGSNNVFWSNTTICHDAVIGNHNFFAANTTIGGEVTVGSRCFFGFSSVVLQQKIIGDDVLIGAQTLMLTNGESLAQFLGSPAIKIRSIDPDVGVCVS